MYIFARLAERFATIVVPGVTSLTAAAARLGRPLAARNEILTVLPAPLEEAVLERQLGQCEAAAVIKVGRHFDKVRRVLARLDLLAASAIVEGATTEGENIRRLTDVPEGERPYFSTILVYRGAEAWGAIVEPDVDPIDLGAPKEPAT